MCGVGVAVPQAAILETKAGCETVLNARDMYGEMALISCLTLRASIHSWEHRSSMFKVE